MHAFKNYYIKCTVTGPITSRCRGSTQSAAGVKIAVIGMSASEDTDRSQSLNNLAGEVGVTRLRWHRVGQRKLYANALEKRNRSNGLKSLGLWGLQGPTSQHLFFCGNLSVVNDSMGLVRGWISSNPAWLSSFSV